MPGNVVREKSYYSHYFRHNITIAVTFNNKRGTELDAIGKNVPRREKNGVCYRKDDHFKKGISASFKIYKTSTCSDSKNKAIILSRHEELDLLGELAAETLAQVRQARDHKDSTSIFKNAREHASAQKDFYAWTAVNFIVETGACDNLRQFEIDQRVQIDRDLGRERDRPPAYEQAIHDETLECPHYRIVSPPPLYTARKEDDAR
jgi:hypothetical protein